MVVGRRICSKDLAQVVELTEANLSILRTAKAPAIRFSRFEPLVLVLGCQLGNLLRFERKAASLCSREALGTAPGRGCAFAMTGLLFGARFLIKCSGPLFSFARFNFLVELAAPKQREDACGCRAVEGLALCFLEMA